LEIFVLFGELLLLEFLDHVHGIRGIPVHKGHQGRNRAQLGVISNGMAFQEALVR